LKLLTFLFMALIFLTGATFFLYRGSELIVESDYVGALIHLLIGAGTARASLELARLASLPPT